MNEVSLYRKYRPQKFADVVGQEHVVRVLEKALKTGNVTHSYLFHGSRGTGKTSVARILAHELKCAPEDLYEIDAASNRGIDDVRELRDAVRTHPFRSPYKVYIIDEVHMLTKEAFNALLKTLEEPPAHVIFVLATTEIGKVPETIVSRCELHTFKKPSHKDLKNLLIDVSKKEGYTLEPSAADLLSLLGDGSFRDAQGVLQKVLHAVKGKKITLDDVEQTTSAPPQALVRELIGAISKGSLPDALSVVGRAAEANVDFKLFIQFILRIVRLIVLLRYAPAMKEKFAVEFSDDELAFVDEHAKDKEAHINSHTILALLDAHTETSFAAIPELPLELALVKLLGEKNN